MALLPSMIQNVYMLRGLHTMASIMINKCSNKLTALETPGPLTTPLASSLALNCIYNNNFSMFKLMVTSLESGNWKSGTADSVYSSNRSLLWNRENRTAIRTELRGFQETPMNQGKIFRAGLKVQGLSLSAVCGFMFTFLFVSDSHESLRCSSSSSIHVQ